MFHRVYCNTRKAAKYTIFCGLLVFLFNARGNAQAAECQFSSGCVTVSRAAAEKALVDADTVKAQAAEIAVLKQALLDEKLVAVKLKIEFAEKSGELTALKQNAVSDRAIIDLLLKNTKKKCLPLSICF